MALKFPDKLYALLLSLPDSIGGWTDGYKGQPGTGFVIRDEKKLAESIFPQYFRTTQFSSFVRQLHHYGFETVSGNREFRHRYFQRDKPELLRFVCRVSNRSKTKKRDFVKKMLSRCCDSVKIGNNTFNIVDASIEKHKACPQPIQIPDMSNILPSSVEDTPLFDDPDLDWDKLNQLHSTLI